MRFAALPLSVLLAIGVSACGSEVDDGPLGTESQAQIDPGLKDYVIYSLTDGNGSQVGKVLVTRTAGDGFSANREYWYMASNLSNGSAVTFTGGAATTWRTHPTGLGTLSFTTVRTPSWTLGASTGSMLAYSNPLTGEYDGMDWEMSNASGAWTGSITWWSNTTGNLFGPGVSRTLSPTSTSVTDYYYVSTPL
jgi:hypothetical protein